MLTPRLSFAFGERNTYYSPLEKKKEEETLCAVIEIKRYSLSREKNMKSFAILRVKNTPRSSVFQQGALSTKFLTATRVYEPHCLIPDE